MQRHFKEYSCDLQITKTGIAMMNPVHPGKKNRGLSDLTAIIVTYNSEKVILKCLRPLMEIGIKTVVVDNSSSDRTVFLVQKHHPEAVVLKNTQNLGYGRANNAGLKVVQTSHALIMNPDVVVDRNALENLMDSFSIDDRIVVTVPVTRDMEQRDFNCADHPEYVNIRKNSACKVSGQHLYIRWFSGGCFATDIEKLKNRVGYFDENIFLYWEDDDLAGRITDSGLEIVMNTKAVIIHPGEQSSGDRIGSRLTRLWHDSWSFCYIYKKQHGTMRFFFKFLKLVTDAVLHLMLLTNTRTHFIRLHACLSFLAGQKAFHENGIPRRWSWKAIIPVKIQRIPAIL